MKEIKRLDYVVFYLFLSTCMFNKKSLPDWSKDLDTTSDNHHVLLQPCHRYSVKRNDVMLIDIPSNVFLDPEEDWNFAF